MTRAAVAFPGRDAYGPASLGSLPTEHEWVRRADDLRAERGLEPVTDLDRRERFEPRLHLRPSNAWPLVFLCGLLDAERIAADHEVVVVVASSTGWFAALAATGALDFDDAFRLTQEMALAADAPLPDGSAPGELVYPLADDAWRSVEDRSLALDEAVAAADGAVTRAVELGAFAIAAGTSEAVTSVAERLPPVQLGPRSFPLRLAGGDAWHTPLRRDAAEAAAERLGELEWRAPNVTLVDGEGLRFSPWSSDPAALGRRTLEVHPRARWDFATALRVALRDYAPEVILLPGPGGSLGAPCAHLVVAEGYRGIRSRAEFEAVQASPDPILLSLRR